MTHLELIYFRLYPNAYRVIAKHDAIDQSLIYLAQGPTEAQHLKYYLLDDNYNVSVEPLADEMEA